MLELSKLLSARLHLSYYSLKIIYGIIALVAGFDKFFHFFSSNAEQFVSPYVTALIPLSAMHIIYGIAILEIIIGVLILSKFTKWGAYAMMIWYAIIIVDLLTLSGFAVLALSNAGHAIANFTLAQLATFVEKYTKHENAVL